MSYFSPAFMGHFCVFTLVTVRHENVILCLSLVESVVICMVSITY